MTKQTRDSIATGLVGLAILLVGLLSQVKVITIVGGLTMVVALIAAAVALTRSNKSDQLSS
jgi:choline-glycine betaine transporter